MAYHLSSASKSCLDGVHPDLVRVIMRAITITDIDFKVIEGVRTVKRQRALVAKGASKTMNSRHIPGSNGYGHAVDIVPLMDVDGDGDIDGKDMWAWPAYHRLAKVIKQAAALEGVKIEWGGDWRKFKDGPHWQLPWKKYPGDKPVTKRFAAVRAEHIETYPKVKPGTPQPAEVAYAPKIQPKTEQAHAAQVAVASLGGGLTTGGAITGGDTLSALVGTLQGQTENLSSGDFIRIAIGLVVVGVSAYGAWKVIKGAR